VNNIYRTQHRPDHRTEGPAMDTNIISACHYHITPHYASGVLWAGRVAGLQLSLNLLQDNAFSAHTSYTSSMVPRTAGAGKDADKEMRIRERGQLVDDESRQPKLLGVVDLLLSDNLDETRDGVTGTRK
jgi:hypothetical protein